MDYNIYAGLGGSLGEPNMSELLEMLRLKKP